MSATVVTPPIRVVELEGEAEIRYWLIEAVNLRMLLHPYSVGVLGGFLRQFQSMYSDCRLSLDYDPYAAERLSFMMQRRYERSLPHYFACGCDASSWQIPVLGQRVPHDASLEELPARAGLVEVFLFQGDRSDAGLCLSGLGGGLWWK